MSAKRKSTTASWMDPDDAPELTRAIAERAQISAGGKVIREATGTVTRRGRPPVGDVPKQQVTLRLSKDVLDHFKAGGPGWQTRISDALERHAHGSVIRAFYYRASPRALEIEFVTGRRYLYHDVPPEEVEALRSAPSKGRYFNSHMRDRYTFDELAGGRGLTRGASRTSANQNDVTWRNETDTAVGARP
jgi:uncharacterized protein (DUF4415 family)